MRPQRWRRNATSRVPRFSLLVPLLGFVAGGVWGVITTGVDQALSSSAWLADDPDFQAFRDPSRAVIESVGPPMLTFIGVVFSLTLVAVQMAAENLTPRVVRLFMQSRVTKTALALFLGTFFYTLVVRYLSLHVEDKKGRENEFVPFLSGFSTMVLVACCVLAFIAYVQHTLRLMRLTEVVDLLMRETLKSVHVVRALSRTREPAGDEWRGVEYEVCHAGQPGVLIGLHRKALVRDAARNKCGLRLLARTGDYLVPGSPLYVVYETGDRPVRRPGHFRRHIRTGSERGSVEDVAFGLRQLVDIGLRALSNSVNDPTTAVQVLDRIQVVLTACARVPWGDIEYRDRTGAVRLVERAPTWDDLVVLGCEEMLLHCGPAPQVTRRFAALLHDLEALAPPDRRPVVTGYRERLEEHVERAFPEPERRRFAAVPDRQGIG
ncbi:DUF2254 domain-containing protein [Streptomyces sp. NPDC006422]|uniref:DUF2254 domain-containing protein n=1 Tax=unclassified Streptomyces TaxID=2593676 RepID=UPI0033AC3539